MTHKIFISVIIFLLFTGFSNLYAQQNKIRTQSSEMISDTLGDVIIQASKDNSTLREIPAAVSIISAKTIFDNGISSISDVTAIVPNFYMPDYGSKLTSPLYIRGIGSRINAPSVGLYVDHVPYFEKAAFDFDFFDIERIEVLRGPQGTQYGRNTMGGIVNVVTKSPLDYQGTNFNLMHGTYGTYSFNAGHYGKINDALGYSFAVNYLHNDGFYRNTFLNNTVDKLNSFGLRNRLIWKLSDRLSIENIANYEKSNQGGYPYALYNDSLKKAGEVRYNQYSTYNRNLFSDALVLNYNANSFNFLSTTSYQYLRGDQAIDQDFTVDSVYFVLQNQTQNMFSQEMLIRSKGAKKYNWLFGAYGFMQQFNDEVNVETYKTKTALLKQYDHRIMGYAFFHQSSINDLFIENLSLTGGIRIDSENDLMGYYYDKNVKGLVTNLADTVYPALKSFEILPKLALNYKFRTNNFYAVIARGYKTGGFNTTFERPEDLTFAPEFSWNYEAGAKTSLLNNKLYADFALFYIDWKNQQIYQTVPSGRGSMLKNAGHSVSKGFETSIRTQFIKNIDFMISYGYTHATFISNVVNATKNYNGKFVPFVPRHTLAVQSGKTFEMKNTSIIDKLKVNLLYRGAGEIFWSEENSHKQPFYGVLDARISLIRKSWQFDFWGSNVLNTAYETFYFESLGNKYVQMNKPLQLGVSLSLKLK